MTDRHVYLIRTGQYDDDGQPDDAPLTEIGQKQALSTGRALAGLPIRRVMYGPYEHTRQTASAIIKSLAQAESHESDLLRDYISLESEGDTIHPSVIRVMFEKQRKQLETAFKTFFVPSPDETRHEVLICHADLIRDLICRAINVNPETWSHMLLNHCGISTVSIAADGEMRLVGHNDVRHLPESLRTQV